MAAGSIERACPLCGNKGATDIMHLRSIPVICNQLWPNEKEARAAPSCDIDLAICEHCTLVRNRAFRPDRIAYAPGYENALHFSPTFQAFAEGLCADLVHRHRLVGKDVIELGCGDGYFLELLVRNGARSATGYDPSMAGKLQNCAASDGVTIIPEYFNSNQLSQNYQALICRHVLEHLPDPLAMLMDVRAALDGDACLVYFEVPNAEWMLQRCGVWDVIYEHVTYWTPASLRTLFVRAGFAPVSIRAGYGDQFLMVEAYPAPPQPDYVPAARERECAHQTSWTFATAAADVLSGWRATLDELGGLGRRAVIWGAGSKGITFATAVNGNNSCLLAMVDLNTRKHGMYVPIAALPVVSPFALKGLGSDLVLISNGLYAGEIKGMIRDLGLTPEVQVIAT